eukprot:5480752-Pleurochrysis_carterae.AAC.3
MFPGFQAATDPRLHLVPLLRLQATLPEEAAQRLNFMLTLEWELLQQARTRPDAHTRPMHTRVCCAASDPTSLLRRCSPFPRATSPRDALTGEARRE